MDPILIFFVVMLIFLYLLLVRPQRQQAKRHQEMLQSLAVGDEVITAGGIYGEVTALDEERVQLEIDADVRIAVSRRAIASKVPAEEAADVAEEPAGEIGEPDSALPPKEATPPAGERAPETAEPREPSPPAPAEREPSNVGPPEPVEEETARR